MVVEVGHDEKQVSQMWHLVVGVVVVVLCGESDYEYQQTKQCDYARMHR